MKNFKQILMGAFIGILVGILALLSSGNALGKSTPVSLSIAPLPITPLTENSSVDDVLALMLESDQKWDSMIANYALSIRDPENFTLSQQHQENQKFWFSKKGEWARVEIEVGGVPQIVFVRNAATLNQKHRQLKIYFQSEIPGVFLYDGFDPRQWLLDTGPAVVYLHPYGKALPTSYYDFLYPTAIAQSMISHKADGTEDIQIVGEDEVAGRKVILISRMPKNHLYWVDAVTGVILRAQYIGDVDSWQLQYEAQSISFDEHIPGSVFHFVPDAASENVPPAEYRERERSQNN